jgi:outer membrane protein assembly factor BamB
MKKLCSTGILLIVSVCVFAQLKMDFLSNEITIGRNFKENSDIKAKEYVFKNNIASWHIDDSTRVAILQLKDTAKNSGDQNDIGELISFDLNANRIKWHQKLDYQNTIIDQFNSVLIKSVDSKSSCLKNEDGEGLWQSENTIYYVSPNLKIGIGYKYDDNNKLEGIDMVTGKTIWTQSISRELGVNEISQLNDSVIIVVAKGIHLLNLKNGTGWDYEFETGKKDYSGTIAANLVSFGLSMLLKSDMDVYTGYALFTDIVSNALVDSSSICIANKSSVVRLGLDGSIIWEKNLPRKMGGKSNIFVKDGSLYMINYGYAFMEGKLVSYGKPFIASFNKNTGNQSYLNTIGYKNEILKAYHIKEDTLLLLSKNRIFKYSLKSGFELWETRYKTDSLGELTQFASADMYLPKDSIYTNLYLSDSTNTYVYTNKNNLMILNNELVLQKTIPVNDIFYCYLDVNGYKFLENGNFTVVVDKRGLKVAELNISGNILLKGNRLFEVEGNSLAEINIDQFTKKQ